MDVILWFIHVVALACFFIPYVGAQVSTTTIPSTWRVEYAPYFAIRKLIVCTDTETNAEPFAG